MRAGILPSLCCTLLLLRFAPGATALVTEHKILHSSHRCISLGRFGFLANGSVEVNASALAVYSPERAIPPDTTFLGFLVVPDSDAAWVEEQAQGTECPLSSPKVTKVFSVSDMGLPTEDGERPSKAAAVTVASSGFHTLFFVNCIPARLVSTSVQVKMYNNAPGGSRLYLPAGMFNLAIVDAVLAGLYALLLVAWLVHVLKVWCQAIAPPAYQILLTVLLPLLAATSACSAASLYTRQVYGASVGVDWALDLLLLASGTILLVAFCTGLDRVDPYLTDTERLVIFTAVPTWLLCQLALMASTNSALFPLLVTPESAPHVLQEVFWGLVVSLLLLLLLLSFELMACCCALLLRRKGRSRDDREEDGPLSKYYVQTSLVLLATTILGYALPHVLPFFLAWLPDALGRIAFFGFLGYTLFRVRPRLEKSVYQLFDENDEVDEELDEL